MGRSKIRRCGVFYGDGLKLRIYRRLELIIVGIKEEETA